MVRKGAPGPDKTSPSGLIRFLGAFERPCRPFRRLIKAFETPFLYRLVIRKTMKLQGTPDPKTHNAVEPWLEWQKRTLARARAAITTNRCNICDTVSSPKTSWAQHVSRFGLGSKEPHLLKLVILYRNRRWQSQQKCYNKAVWDTVFHYGAGRAYLWEQSFGTNWYLSVTQDGNS